MTKAQNQTAAPDNERLAFEIGKKQGWNKALFAATEIIREMASTRGRSDVNATKAIVVILAQAQQ